jgi:hypothetical protein
MEQLSRNSNERLQTGFVSSQEAIKKGFAWGSQRDATRAGM